MYETIKANILSNFLNRNYLYTCVFNKESLFANMMEHTVFPFEYDYDNDVLNVNLGDGISVSFNFIWNIGEDGIGRRYRLVKIV